MFWPPATPKDMPAAQTSTPAEDKRANQHTKAGRDAAKDGKAGKEPKGSPTRYMRTVAAEALSQLQLTCWMYWVY
jgi:hypothetical protein